MRRIASLAWYSIIPLLLAPPAGAQSFSGTFTDLAGAGGATLRLDQHADGSVLGSFTNDGLVWRVDARLDMDAAVGVMEGSAGRLFFEAHRSGDEVWLTLTGSDERGRPVSDDFEELILYLDHATADGRLGAFPGRGNPLAPGIPGGVYGTPPAGGDPFVGAFSDGFLTLWLQGAGGRYQGQISVSGAVYPVTATRVAQGLRGVMQAEDGSYDIEVLPNDGGLLVSSGGNRYQLYPEARTGGLAPAPGYAPGAGVRPGWGAGGSALGRLGGARSRTGRLLAPGFTTEHPEAYEWSRLLAGNKLARLEAYPDVSTGYRSRADVHLCSDYTFALRDDRAGFDRRGFPEPAGPDRVRGDWSVITNGQVVALLLESGNGEILEYRLDQQNGQVFADGRRVILAPADLCR